MVLLLLLTHASNHKANQGLAHRSVFHLGWVRPAFASRVG